MTLLPEINRERDCLFLDIDGTLLDLMPTPDAVTVPAELLLHLKRLQQKLHGALGLISGRDFENIDKLFPLSLPGAAVHGAVCRFRSGGPIIATAQPLPEALLSAISALTTDEPGFFIEDKGYAIAVHYRAAMTKRDTLEQTLLTLVGTTPLPLRVMAGHAVFEILSARTDKGQALNLLMKQPPFLGRRPIFLGDDMTDLPAITAAQQLGGYGIRVGSDHGLLPDQVREWIRAQATV